MRQELLENDRSGLQVSSAAEFVRAGRPSAARPRLTNEGCDRQPSDPRTSASRIFRVRLESVRAAIDIVAVTLPELGTGTPITRMPPRRSTSTFSPTIWKRSPQSKEGNLAGFISTLLSASESVSMLRTAGSEKLSSATPSESNSMHGSMTTSGGTAGRGPVDNHRFVACTFRDIHVVVAVLAVWSSRRYSAIARNHPSGAPLPTVLVLEEAHTFVRRRGTKMMMGPQSHLRGCVVRPSSASHGKGGNSAWDSCCHRSDRRSCRLRC